MRAGVPTGSSRCSNGGHGEFDGADVLLVNRAVRDFLLKHGILQKGQSELLQ